MSGLKQTTEEAKETRAAIRGRMADVRTQIASDVESVADGFRSATDWKSQVAQHPLLAAGAASAIGFWLVPSRPKIKGVDPETLERLAKQQKLVVTDRPEAEKQAGLIAAGLAIAANFALRAATAYVGQQAGQMFGEKKAGSTETNGVAS